MGEGKSAMVSVPQASYETSGGENNVLASGVVPEGSGEGAQMHASGAVE